MSIVANQQLFSHTYLAQLQADPSYDEAAARIAQGLRDWLPSRDTSSLPSLIETWVGPVLDFLGFHHVPADDSSHVHLLYASRGDQTPIGLCYVVPPGQDLNDTTKDHHPMAQAVLALRARSLRWGVLTDGTRWRLVDAQSLRRYEHYLEIDLEGLARSDDPTPLRLFYTLFHRSAFSPSPCEGEGRVGVGLDRLAAGSERATRRAEDHLKARVSHNEGIMAQLCLGLVRADGTTHGGRRYTEAERDAIYRDATYLLYRMLFILYAEARGLLPVEEPAYRAVSLAELVQTARDYKLRGMPDPQATTLWERLRRLSNAIYESDLELGIPAYDGGLFDDADKPYLREGHIADAYLTEALFDLAYMPDKVPGTSCRPIDYRDLSVRHLGSLYEGMIEYKLQIAEETLWARRDGKGNLRFLRTGQDGAPRKTDEEIKPGSVYFSQSPGERRATGTYYTPEYIVDYIVRQTVVRSLEERRAALEEKLSGWQEGIAATSDSDERARMQRAADEELLRFVEEQVLTFRVCDPGMGSGHFLVNAAHQITDFIVETLHLAPWPHPLTAFAGPQSSGPCIDADPVAWRRRVVEHCLYGVDLSLMAVELAKLSLWLASVAEGKPLSFLDHHLRQGNSLIGARLEDLAEVLAGVVSTKPSRKERKAREAGQLSMLDHPAFRQHVTAATDLLAQISARIVERVEDVKAQEADYEHVRAELEPYRRLADLWTARHFGVKVNERELRDISRYLTNGAVGLVPEYQRLLNEAQQLANEWHFFHRELEFPKVFYGPDQPLGNIRGFDTIVANPPYGMLQPHNVPQSVLDYLKAQFEASAFKVDMFALFVEAGVGSTGESGTIGMIVPNTFVLNVFAQGVRQLLLDQTEIQHLLVSQKHLFPEADVHNAIFIARRVAQVSVQRSTRIRVVQDVDVEFLQGREDCSSAVISELTQDRLDFTGDGAWNIKLSDQAISVLDKIQEQSNSLSDISSVNRGLITGDRERYFADRAVDHRWHPILAGGDIHRYFTLEPKEYVLFERPKTAGGCWDEEVHFHPRKLVMRQIGSYPCVAVDYNQYCVTGNIFTVRIHTDLSPLYVLAILNSSLVRSIWTLLFQDFKVSFTELKAEHIKQLPIRCIKFTTAANERAELAEKGQELYNVFRVEENSEHVISFVQRQLSQQPAHVDVVHDLLAYLAQQMIDLNKEHQRLERETNLFRFVEQVTPCMRLDKALGGPLAAGEIVSDLSAVHHDIEVLRLTQEDDSRWLLEVRAKLRAPESGWREHQRDRDGNFIRRWLPVYRLPLDETTGRFFHYAFAHLDGFDGAGKFPGGYTRTTLEKLNATKVPRFVPVDLAPLAALEAELAEVRRKIRLTDDLIDQIVYKLYGLTEEEIAIVEG